MAIHQRARKNHDQEEKPQLPMPQSGRGLTRRSFLSIVGATGAAVTAAPMLVAQLAPAQSASSATSAVRSKDQGAEASSKTKTTRTLLVTYRGSASDRFDREYFVNRHLPLAREIGGPFGLLSIEAFFPAGAATDIAAACLIVFRDEQAAKDLFTAPRIKELLNDRTNYTDLMPVQNLVTELKA